LVCAPSTVFFGVMHATIGKIFQEKFHTVPTIVRAPGRINFIGEHTDYNEGLVLPAAIDREIWIAAAANGTDTCHLFSPDLNESHSFSIHDLKPGRGWINYLQGVVQGIDQIGFPAKGMDVAISGNIPLGAGLSSSAALCCGFGMAYSHVLGLGLSKLAIAKVAQYAEHNFAGVKCGIMDQYASLFGKKDHALLVDCKTLEHEPVPFLYPNIEILLIDTKVKHSLADTAYNNRREACEKGITLIRRKYDVSFLRDVSMGMLNDMKEDFPDDVFRRCHYVVKEMARTKQAVHFLKQHDVKSFGKLLYDTHDGLSRDYEVSCGESDFLVSLAKANRKVLGARQMGGGFGGCTINLVDKGATSEFIESVDKKYSEAFNKKPDFYKVSLAEGVEVVG
jgi:galactokinase